MNREFFNERLALADPGTPGELPPEQLDVWLDRLVDGEVAEPQRRALLARLERSPDGWRRCALAFLESQAWREALVPGAPLAGDLEGSQGDGSPDLTELRDFAERDDAAAQRALPFTSALSPKKREGNDSPRLAWHLRPLIGMVAAAASFALAFGLGLLVHKTWLSHERGDRGASAVGPTQPLGGVPSEPLAASGQPWPGAMTTPTPTTPGPMKWGAVQFVVDGPGGAPEQVRLPAVDGPDPERWLREQPPAIPEEIVQELRRRGHHVETQRHYVPVPLDDGRSAVFPVDQVDVRFRGGKGYQ